MTPKEKAEELIEKFRDYSHTDFSPVKGGYQEKSQIENAQKCALICIDQILESYLHANVEYEDGQYENFWKEVKEEIEKP